MALSRGAQTYDWVCPQVTKTKTLQIEGGRHPLQELVVSSFVPNDCHLGQDGDFTDESLTALVLTGPNHSGKSIYLKQTAIITYLAHIGSFVPATQAVIGLTDKILTRISTKESVSRNESAFAIDIRQMAQAMTGATSRSLVIVDEFGKGTSPHDGAGLLAAALDHFLNLKTDSPRLLVATHFHELFEGGLLGEHQALAVAHMDVRTDWTAGQPDDQITYLFRLCKGHSSSSFGVKCAALNGVPTPVVHRAEAISQLLARNEDLSSACAKLSDQEELRLEVAEVVARRFLQTRFEERILGGETGGGLGLVLSEILAPASQV